MPFQSGSQRRACFALKSRLEKAGKPVTWDCHKWAHESPKQLPDYKYASAKVHTGPRGGKYVLNGTRKVYVKH